MNKLYATGAALALTAALSMSPAMAEGPRASGGGYAPNATEATVPPQQRAPHWEWQHSYVGHHPRYDGHWVLVR